MPDERLSMQNNDEQGLSQRTQRLIESLGDLWQHPHQLSSEKLKRIIEFVVHFPESYRSMAMTKIAEYLVDNMGLHFLDIMATFQQKAEQEGIDRKECEGTFQDIMPELFPTMMRLSRNLSVRSFDDLVRLSNITFSLYGLSQADTAEEAQRWMYTLPKVYHNQLERDHLISSMQGQVTLSFHAEITSSVTQQPQFTVNGRATLSWNVPGPTAVGPTILPSIDSTGTDHETALVA